MLRERSEAKRGELVVKVRIPLDLGTRSDDLGTRSGTAWAAESERSDDRRGQVVGVSEMSLGARPFFLRMDCPRSVRT